MGWGEAMSLELPRAPRLQTSPVNWQTSPERPDPDADLTTWHPEELEERESEGGSRPLTSTSRQRKEWNSIPKMLRLMDKPHSFISELFKSIKRDGKARKKQEIAINTHA
ncbi:cytochrome P450 2K1-like [Platysternon megacephalum]|uniref:Cytochrome P450 2K1-like n=1 Tax=Platysternon megacephalum TaxID=55544 RepID=A0A4D9EFR8_9SAUR|nr:cytochrome P450 2K1-like [Platysternon megacephalum]